MFMVKSTLLLVGKLLTFRKVSQKWHTVHNNGTEYYSYYTRSNQSYSKRITKLN